MSCEDPEDIVFHDAVPPAVVGGVSKKLYIKRKSRKGGERSMVDDAVDQDVPQDSAEEAPPKTRIDWSAPAASLGFEVVEPNTTLGQLVVAKWGEAEEEGNCLELRKELFATVRQKVPGAEDMNYNLFTVAVGRLRRAQQAKASTTGRKPAAKARADKPEEVEAAPVVVEPEVTAEATPRPVPIQPAIDEDPTSAKPEGMDEMLEQVVLGSGLTVKDLLDAIKAAGAVGKVLMVFAYRGALATSSSSSPES